jgi:3-hydroxybutyrate dehydrogenase
VKRAAIFGASGGLACALTQELLAQGWGIDAICRTVRADTVRNRFGAQIVDGTFRLHEVGDRYTDFKFQNTFDAVVFTQALFEPRPLSDMAPDIINDEVTVGLTDPMLLTQDFLRSFPSSEGSRRDVCFVGSTSAYAGFKYTSVYCAVKHGLLGFVRALNDEYALTDDRFWLFSMGTMRTEMGRRVQGQDASTYLDPQDVARRMVSAFTANTNLFEPEVIIRRRTPKFL